MYRTNKKNQGFTLIEMVMAITIAGVISLAFSGLLLNGMKAWFYLKGQGELISEANNAMQRMVREVRRTKNPGAIIAFTSTRYQFTDIDNAAINYQKNSTSLERNATVLLSDLANADGLAFVYLDRSGAVTAVKNNIHTVRITLKLQKSNNAVILRSAAGIRNGP